MMNIADLKASEDVKENGTQLRKSMKYGRKYGAKAISLQYGQLQF